MINEILLRRKLKLLVVEKENPEMNNQAYVATINKNIESLGYTFSKELFGALCSYSKEELGDFYIELITALKNMKGADVRYNPMYPNFPRQVMEMSTTELYINAIVHYWSNGTLFPVSARNERLPLFDEGKVEILGLGSPEELDNIFINLVNSKTSLSQTDKDDIAWFFKNRSRVIDLLPESIPYKENAAYLCKLYEESGCCGPDLRYRYLKTPTDILRYITALSDGDISLAENTKFRNFKRSERRLILSLLERCRSLEPDMARNPERWIRVGEKLHPTEQRMATLFPKSARVFDKLRNEGLQTDNSIVDAAIRNEDWDSAIDRLVKKPGEYARKLDFLLRESKNPQKVIKHFREISTNISTPVLLQVREHFIHRNDSHEYRVFFPKGSLAKSYNIPNKLPKIKTEYCEEIVDICEGALLTVYGERSEMGKVYLTESFKGYVVPFSQRSASKALRTIVRGSRIPIDEDAKAIRGFIWWTNFGKGTRETRVDLDLSVTFFDEHWEHIEHVSYTNLRSNKFKACHSGDITNGGPENGDGAAEFLDININSVIRGNARYAVFQVYDFTGLGFDKLTNAKFGWMERKDVNSGEIFEPKTVTQKMDLTAKTSSCIPVIFDTWKREFIWCDMAGDVSYRHSSNVENSLSRVEATCYSMVNMQKPNLYDLLMLNIVARGGEMVADKKDADIIFDIEDGITPYDTEVFMSEYL